MDTLGGFVDPSLSASSRSSTPAPSTTAPAPARSAPTAESSSSHDRPEVGPAPTLDLDREVQNVIAGFGSFWGKVRKQSTAAFFTAEKQLESTRKDLDPFLSKAKANLDTFSATARAEVQRLSEAQPTDGASGVVIGPDGVPVIVGDPEPAKVDKGKGVDRSDSTATATTSSENPSAAASAFFSRLQTQLSSVHAPAALSTLSTNFTQFQQQLSHLDLGHEGAKLAEDYLHKGEAWFGEFKDEVTKLAKDAVQIVPPVSAAAAIGGASTTAKSESTGRRSEEFLTKMSRKDVLLYRLRTDPELLAQDPSLPPPPSSTDLTDHRAAYASFLSTLPADISDKTAEAREEGGEALEKTFEKVTAEGSGVGEEEFWKRYLFRVHIIEEEEEKRKKVLSVAQQDDDDFTWDDDEETPASPADPASQSASHTPQPSLASSAPVPPPAARPRAPSTSDSAALSSHPQTRSDPPWDTDDAEPERETPAIDTPPTNQSRRTSSSENENDDSGSRRSLETGASYDLVGERSGNPSVDGDRDDGAEKDTGASGSGTTPTKKVEPEADDDDDDDSDWE
ncbi:hypothetical protein JCM10212_000355 [Sporobolomyces blumeae]